MKEVKQQRIRRGERTPRHDPEWEAVFHQDFPDVPDDLFTREN